MQHSSLAMKDIRQVAQKMRQAGLSDIEISSRHYKVRLRYEPGQRIASVSEPASLRPDAMMASAPVQQSARSTMPGHVLLFHPLNGTPFAEVGATVQKGAVLALIKVGLIYLPLRSPTAGIVASLTVNHGDSVEYDSEIAVIRECK